jgi:hypothetical protein
MRSAAAQWVRCGATVMVWRICGAEAAGAGSKAQVGVLCLTAGLVVRASQAGRNGADGSEAGSGVHMPALYACRGLSDCIAHRPSIMLVDPCGAVNDVLRCNWTMSCMCRAHPPPPATA